MKARPYHQESWTASSGHSMAPMSHPRFGHPDLTERVAVIETEGRHLNKTVQSHEGWLQHNTDQINSIWHHINGMMASAAATAAMRADVTKATGWIEAEDKRRAARDHAKTDRREARREALAFLQYVAGLILLIAAMLGYVPWDKLTAAKGVLSP